MVLPLRSQVIHWAVWLERHVQFVRGAPQSNSKAMRKNSRKPIMEHFLQVELRELHAEVEDRRRYYHL